MTVTRAEYMADSANLHQAYYLQFARAVGMRVPADMVARTRKALAAGDEHLNTIPLGWWDSLASGYSLTRSRCEAADDVNGNSLGSKVCALKALARELASNPKD